MLSEVPAGWEIKTLGEVAKIRYGFAFKCSDFIDEAENTVVIVRMSDLKGGTVLTKKAKRIPSSKTNGLDMFRLTAGDFVFGMSGSLRNYAIVPELPVDLYLNQRVGKLEPTNSELPFLYYLYTSEEFLTRVENSASGNAQLNISRKQLESFEVTLPPLNEQRRIAEILSSVDTSIQATQAVMEQAARVKRGLMEELLTGGLGTEAIERGEVPAGWEIKTLGEVANLFAGGTPNRKKTEFYEPGEIAWVKSGELRQGVITHTEENISLSGLENSSTKLVPAHTPVIAMYGATAGEVGWLSIEASTNQAVLACLPNTGIEAKFLFYLLIYVSKDLVAHQQGGAQPNLSKNLIASFEVTLPPLNEQRRIAEILSSIDEFIAEQKNIIKQQTVIKKGLMDDLLTGKVRTV